jgi:hypothetical protein
MMKLFRDFKTDSLHVEYKMADILEHKLGTRIVEELTNMWIEKYGAKVLETLSSDVMEDEIKKAIKQRFAEKILK